MGVSNNFDFHLPRRIFSKCEKSRIVQEDRLENGLTVVDWINPYEISKT